MASANTPIAIVGMACRFPGDATTPEKLWDLLASGRSAWSKIPESRFTSLGIHHPNGERVGSSNVQGGHFLDQDPASFDAQFFNLSAEVASTMDPQFRLTLEVVYEAMESAGISMADFDGSDTSVYAGCMLRDYHDTLARDPDLLPRYFMTSNASTMASNRVSHFYGLHGPSMTVDTGCSTTLTALHLACQNLKSGESSTSVVTGVNLILNPDYFVTMSSIGFLSPDGKSYAFDDRANGYGRGEGVAAIILKRLDDAVAAGDPIRAVIRATALNQDGRTTTITTPSQNAQKQLIEHCYLQAGINPLETGYVEAHGTGTSVGDPIEIGAISEALAGPCRTNSPLLVGSLKAAIGHTEAASGLASVIKVAVGLERGLIAPNCDFQSPNDKLDLTGRHITIPQTVQPWPVIGSVRRASINNFGFGGANAHVVMEEYLAHSQSMPNGASDASLTLSEAAKASLISSSERPVMFHKAQNTDVSNGDNREREFIASTNGHDDAPSELLTNGTIANGPTTSAISSCQSKVKDGYNKDQTSQVFVIYGKNEDGCKRTVANLRDYVLSSDFGGSSQQIQNLAYTLGERRSTFPWMITVSANRSIKDLSEALNTEKSAPVRLPAATPRIGYVFNGQGAQWPGMSRELMSNYPVFRESIEALDGYIRDLGAQWSLIDELSRDDETSNIHNLVYSLPMCSAIQIALVDLLRSWGISPTAVTGHSSGEVAAAYAAGALDARAAIAIPYLRGALSTKTDKIIGKGGMLAVGLGRKDAGSYMSLVTAGKVTVACVNSQKSVTASGDISAIEELEQLLAADGVFCRRLRINGAFHSDHMSPISATYMAELEPLLYSCEKQHSGTRVIFSSSMTGDRLQDLSALAKPSYWNSNMLGVVEFESSFRNMCITNEVGGLTPTSQVDAVIEVGPHGSLGGPIQDLLTLPEFEGIPISYLNCLVRKKSAVYTMQALACDLLRRGFPVNLRAVNFPSGFNDVQVLCDLPHYPWNHSTRFWLESRVNKAWRNRSDTIHDILGSYQSIANSYCPTWRNILRTSNLPWLRDHMVGPNIVFPGAAYICMAIEGAKYLGQRKAFSGNIIGYSLKSIQFMSALIIPDDSQGREVQLTMRPCNERSLGTRGWQEFSVYSVCENNRWTQHCQGLIQVIQSQPSPHSYNSATPVKLNLAKRRSNTKAYTKQVDPEDIWTEMRSVGINHGGTFRNLDKVVGNRYGSVATFSIVDVSTTMPTRHESDYTIHPTTLDSIIQSAYTVLPGLGSHLTTPFLPHSIERLVVESHISSLAGHSFETHVESRTPQNVRRFSTDLTVFDASSSSNAVLEVHGLTCQSLNGGSGDLSPNGNSDSQLYSTFRWGLDLSFPLPAHALDYLKYTIQAEEVSMMMKLRQAVIFYIQDALTALTDDDLTKMEWHHAKHYQWMKTQIHLAADNRLAKDSLIWLNKPTTERLELLKDVAASSVNGEMLQRVGPRIPEILKGETTTLELMLEDGLLYRYYNNVLKFDRSTHQMAQLVKLLAHQNPRANILEIGAGTGGGTQAVLNALGCEDAEGVQFDHYDFTDVSPGFFEAARRRFEPWQHLMAFRKLDIENDPCKQGFEQRSYDIIIACQVLHATRNMQNTMTNVRRLLKPGGRLVLIETTQDSLDVFLSFGLLPGWWLSEEEERKSSPSLTTSSWNGLLNMTGFTGIDHELRDCEDEEFYNFSVILTTVNSDPPVFSSDILLVTLDQSPPITWQHEIQASFTILCGSPPAIESLNSARVQGKYCIFLGDLEHTSTLMNPNESRFAALKAMLIDSEGVLWVTRGGVMESEYPEAALSHGLLRTLKHEYQQKRYITLDVDPQRLPWTPETAAAIVQVFSKSFSGTSTYSHNRDMEYCERQGFIHIPRLFRNQSLVEAFHRARGSSTETSTRAFSQTVAPVRLHIESQGLLDTLTFIKDSDLPEEILSDCVELEPRAFGLNFRDIMVAMGQIGIDTLKASECSGIISRLGRNAAMQGLKVGDRVCALIQDHWTTRPQTHWSGVAKISDNITFETAAAVPVAFTTAYISLFEVAKLQKGESVLIHSAAGGLGQAAIRLCQKIGADIYVTVGSQKKRDFIIEEFAIDARKIFSSRDASFSSAIMERTHGKGVDVVLNALAGSLLQETFNVLADFGRFVELGKRDFEENSQLDMAAFRRNTTFFSVDLISWESRRQAAVGRAMKEVLRLLEGGFITAPQPVTVYPISSVKEAFRFMQTGQHLGKIVITVNESDLVPIKFGPARPAIHRHGSYVIAGGMGGIGRSICEWIVDRGAQHIIVLSRNAKLDKFLMELNVNVRAVPCDVSDKDSLESALASCADMPPVCGIIQSAMVLRDTVFEQMTAEDFIMATRAKVMGSWNLHQLCLDVDFFIMLSSVLGVTGSPAQANYTAAGAYQDALARFRKSKGLPSTCIDLGAVQSVGFVAGNHRISDRLAQSGVGRLQEGEVHNILDSVIGTHGVDQVVTAIQFDSIAESGGSGWLQDKRFAAMRPRDRSASERNNASTSPKTSVSKLQNLISGDMNQSEVSQVILDELSKKIMDMFGTQEVDVSGDLAMHGVDSLVAIELRNWIATQAGIEISVLELIQSPSITQIAERVTNQLGYT